MVQVPRGEEEVVEDGSVIPANIVDSGAVVGLLKVWSFLWTLVASIQRELFWLFL